MAAPHSMPVQSVVFRKGPWTTPAAQAWLRARGFAGLDVDEKPETLRFRQIDPEPGGKYFTKTLAHPPGVQLVIALHGGRLLKQGGRAKEAPVPAQRQPEDFEPAAMGRWGIFDLSRETSDDELDEWARKHIPGFLGVRARSDFDELYPDGALMAPGTSCILNLDYGDGSGEPYARGGTHWVAARVAQDAPLLMYFDAFGMPPPREVTLRSRREGLGLLYPDIQYQGVEEANCGPRALAVLHYLAKAAKKGKELEAFAEIGQV